MRVRSPNELDSPFAHDDVQKRLAEIKDPAYLYHRRMMYQKRKYDELLQKISFLDVHLKPEERRYDYPDDFRPFVFFYKFLARRPDAETNPLNRLKLWFPDTIIIDGDAPPMWFYSTPDGMVHRTDFFNAKNIINKLGSFSSPDELCAVLKKPQGKDFSYIGNDIRLLTLKDLSLIAQSIVSSRGDIVCVQKFVKSMGPKAFVCRTCWRRDKNPYVWVITNTKDFYNEDENVPEHQQYITNANVMNSCTIVNSIRGRYIEETAPYIANIVKYVEHNIPGAKFEEFVADFIKDESGTWWMVNVRGFVLVDKMNVQPRSFLAGPDDIDYMPLQVKKKKPEDYQKVALCKYCEIMYPVEELLHKMTLKSIIQADKHLMHRGKTFKWLERSEIKQIDTVALYQEHKVCDSCYKLHEETEKLRHLEFEFAKALGIPVNPEKKIDLVSATTFGDQDMKNYMLNQTLQSQKALNKSKLDVTDNDLPTLKSNHSAVFSDNLGSPKSGKNQYMKRYRMMLYLHMLYDVPKDIDANKNYYIEYSIFGQKQKYKIDLASAFSINGDILIPLNKLRMFFFFTHDRKNVNEFLNDQKAICLNLYCDNERIGTVSFELTDFLSENVIKREMFKVFSGKKLPILSWGLKASLGLVDGGKEDINRVRLSEHKNVYVTSPDYYTCDALPEEWIQSFEETSHNITQLLSKSEMRSSRYEPGSGMSRNSSARKLGMKNNLKHLGVSKLNTSKEMRVKYDIPEMGSDLRMSSPSRSLFQDEKSISHVQVEREAVDESMEVIKKILIDSIQDYEKGGVMQKKKPASAKPHKIEKSPKATIRTWSSGIGMKSLNE